MNNQKMLSPRIRGYLTVWITGSQVNRFFNLCANRGIYLWDIFREDEGYSAKMKAEDFFRIKDIAKKTDSRLKIKEKKGLLFHLRKQKKRKLFIAGPFICLILLFFLSHFLWSVEISGSYRVTQDVIMDYLQEQGIHIGMPISRIPFAQLEMKLREEYEEINWISVSIEGTRLDIRIKETDVWDEKRRNLSGINLISPVEGTVTDILIRQGTALVKRGDQVKKGDTLIEGKVPVTDENGEIKQIDYYQSDGDVWINYTIPIKEELLLSYEKREYSGKEREKTYLEIGGRKLGVDFRRIPFEQYDLIEERENITLLGDISLPVCICRRLYREYSLRDSTYTQAEGEKILEKRFEKIIEALEKKGVQIIEKNVKIIPNSDFLTLEGNITVLQLHNLATQLEQED